LTVVDTGSKFTYWGQIIILLLIQAGGLGIMTFSTFFILLIFGNFSILDRELIQQTLTQKPIRNITSFLKMIVGVTLILEALGAILLAWRFSNCMPLNKALYYGAFHSISAFCNAGFSLFTNSFEDFNTDYVINIVLIILIISGGLGFVILLDLKQKLKGKKGKERSDLSFHTKLVLNTTVVLIFVGALLFFLFEMKNGLNDLPLDVKILASFFQSITTRTAGFNTINISVLSNSTLFFMIILMFIGASPGSCGGGIKTSTFGILIAFLVAKFQNRQDVNIYHRRVPEEIISRTISIIIFSIIVILFFTLILLKSELGELSHQHSRGLFLEILFEVNSAFGTVGLSTGITSTLSSLGKVILSIVMFIGRLGPLTVALAIGARQAYKYKYPKENFLVG